MVIPCAIIYGLLLLLYNQIFAFVSVVSDGIIYGSPSLDLSLPNIINILIWLFVCTVLCAAQRTFDKTGRKIAYLITSVLLCIPVMMLVYNDIKQQPVISYSVICRGCFLLSVPLFFLVSSLFAIVSKRYAFIIMVQRRIFAVVSFITGLIYLFLLSSSIPFQYPWIRTCVAFLFLLYGAFAMLIRDQRNVFLIVVSGLLCVASLAVLVLVVLPHDGQGFMWKHPWEAVVVLLSGLMLMSILLVPKTQYYHDEPKPAFQNYQHDRRNDLQDRSDHYYHYTPDRSKRQYANQYKEQEKRQAAFAGLAKSAANYLDPGKIKNIQSYIRRGEMVASDIANNIKKDPTALDRWWLLSGHCMEDGKYEVHKTILQGLADSGDENARTFLEAIRQNGYESIVDRRQKL